MPHARHPRHHLTPPHSCYTDPLLLHRPTEESPLRHRSIAMTRTPSTGRGTLFHWGPAFTLLLVSGVSCTTVYVMLEWWPPNTHVGGLVNIGAFLTCVAGILYNLFVCTYTGPGYVPLKWAPVGWGPSYLDRYDSGARDTRCGDGVEGWLR